MLTAAKVGGRSVQIDFYTFVHRLLGAEDGACMNLNQLSLICCLQVVRCILIGGVGGGLGDVWAGACQACLGGRGTERACMDRRC